MTMVAPFRVTSEIGPLGVQAWSVFASVTLLLESTYSTQTP